jgi:hypothetical protein
MKIQKLVVSIALVATTGFSLSATSAENQVIDFSNHSRLIFSAPVSSSLAKKFGSGWTRLTFQQADGHAIPLLSDEALTQDGGVIFSTPGARALSPGGRYLVLDVIRNGTVEADNQKPQIESRQFCPILDTQTGCVTRNDTGAICGGHWDVKQEIWQSVLDSSGPDSQSMTSVAKPTARDVWTQYSNARSQDISPFLRTALGLDNLKACDPPNAANARYYAEIEAQPGVHAATVPPLPPRSAPADSSQYQNAPAWTVRVDQASLYERPSVGSIRHGYLIRGDHVAVLVTEGTDWTRIRFSRAGKPPLDAWLKTTEIAP